MNQENSYRSKRRQIVKDGRRRGRQAGDNDNDAIGTDAGLASDVENNDSDDAQTSIEYRSDFEHANGSDDDRDILSD